MCLKFLLIRTRRKRKIPFKRMGTRNSSDCRATRGILRWDGTPTARRALYEYLRTSISHNARIFRWTANTLRAPPTRPRARSRSAAGKVTGDKELQTEGKLDKAKGSLHNAAGDVKDALRKASKDD